MEVLQNVLVGGFAIFIMLSVGVDLTIPRMVAVFKRPGVLLIGLAFNHLAIPLVALGLVNGFALAIPVSTGILLCASAPGGPIGAMFAQRARGDLAFATSLLVVMTIINTFLTPILLGILGQQELQGSANHTLAMTRTIVLYMLVPLAVGIGIRHKRPELADKLLVILKRATNVIFLILVVGMGFAQYKLAFELGLLPAIVILILVATSILGGYTVAGRNRDLRVALSLSSGVRNVSLALLLANYWFPDPKTMLTVLTYGLFMVMAGAVAMLLLRSHRTNANGPA